MRRKLTTPNKSIDPNKKYEILKDCSIEVDGHTLYRIRALRDVGVVGACGLGGYIESEENLSQLGECWVYYGAKVYGNAHIYGNATVYGNAVISGCATITDNSHVFDNAEIHNNVRVCDNACVYGNARIWGDVNIRDNTRISGNADVYSNFDFMSISGLGKNCWNFTFYKSKYNTIEVTSTWFSGTLNGFREVIKKTYKDSRYAKEFLMAADLAELRLS